MISIFPKEVLVEIYRWLPIRDQANWHLLSRRIYEILPPLLTKEDKEILLSNEWAELCKNPCFRSWLNLVYLTVEKNCVKILRVVANYSFIPNTDRYYTLCASFAHTGSYGNVEVGLYIITLFESVAHVYWPEQWFKWFGTGLSNAYYNKKMGFYRDMKQQLCSRLKLSFPSPLN